MVVGIPIIVIYACAAWARFPLGTFLPCGHLTNMPEPSKKVHPPHHIQSSFWLSRILSLPGFSQRGILWLNAGVLVFFSCLQICLHWCTKSQMKSGGVFRQNTSLKQLPSQPSAWPLIQQFGQTGTRKVNNDRGIIGSFTQRPVRIYSFMGVIEFSQVFDL